MKHRNRYVIQGLLLLKNNFFIHASIFVFRPYFRWIHKSNFWFIFARNPQKRSFRSGRKEEFISALFIPWSALFILWSEFFIKWNARTCLTYKVHHLSCHHKSCLKLHINTLSSSAPSLACIAVISFICAMCKVYIYYIILIVCCECWCKT